ncbi:hypothetical protein [Rhizobium rhizogenes]|uniref:hypothetical protein n=1 Tax=Rhizobium rhizogenes TaxID=359 RepID=UPI0028695FF5|nr:hypothetical protein [Rhizobium rhizogenes]
MADPALADPITAAIGVIAKFALGSVIGKLIVSVAICGVRRADREEDGSQIPSGLGGMPQHSELEQQAARMARDDAFSCMEHRCARGLHFNSGQAWRQGAVCRELQYCHGVQ